MISMKAVLNKFEYYDRKIKALERQNAKLCNQIESINERLETNTKHTLNILKRESSVMPVTDYMKSGTSKEEPNSEITPSVESRIDVKNSCKLKRVGYVTICSSVATTGRVALSENLTTSNKKSVLFGTADDVENFSKYLQSKGSQVTRQGKFEFSNESLNSFMKDEFLRSLSTFFDSPFNNACLIYYSGHGLADTSLLLETAYDNYYVTYEDILQRWRSRQNKRNAHLFIILDCCYAGSWVNELLKSGDFKNVSIQSSSKCNEKSNDLGASKGSLFTSLMISTNKNEKIQQDLLLTSVLLSQSPRGVVCYWSGIFDLLSIIGFNSWQELLSSVPVNYAEFFEGRAIIMSKFYSSDTPNFSLFWHFTFRISSQRLLVQGELPVFEDDKPKGKIIFKIFVSSTFSEKKIGQISAWCSDDEGTPNGIYFKFFKLKELSFKIREEIIQDITSTLTEGILQFQVKKEKFEFGGLETRLNILIEEASEVKKSNFIIDQLAINDDDATQEEIFASLESKQKERSSILKELSISGQLKYETEVKIFKLISSNQSNITSLDLNYSLTETEAYSENLFSKCPLDKLNVRVSKSTSRSLLNAISTVFPFQISNLTINFDYLDTSLSLYLPIDLLSLYPYSNRLKSFTLINTQNPCYFAIFCEMIKSVASLESIHLENFNLSSSDTLIQLIECINQNSSITSISLIDCKINRLLYQFSSQISYLNLSNNYLVNSFFTDLTWNPLGKHSLNLSGNRLSKNSLSEIFSTLKNKSYCTELKLTGNYFEESDMISYAKYCLTIKNYITILDISQTSLGEKSVNDLVSLLSRAKQLTSLEARSCGLVNGSLKQLISIVGNSYNNTIIKLDVSFNLLTEVRSLDQIKLYIKFSNNLEIFKMRGCVMITNDQIKAIDATPLFKGKMLKEVDYSYWTCPLMTFKDFEFTLTLNHLSLIEFPCELMNLELLSIEMLEVDVMTYNKLKLSFCSGISLLNYNSLENKINIPSQISDLNIKSNDADWIDLFIPYVIDEEKNEVELSVKGVKFLTAEDLDDEAASFIVNLVKSNKSILLTQLSVREMYQSLPQVFSDIEMLEEEGRVVIGRRVKEINYDSTNFQNLHDDIKSLRLEGSNFSFNSFNSVVIPALEILELDGVYIKSFVKSLLEFCRRNSGLKILRIKNSEINYQEIQSLIEIIHCLPSLGELHLVNTFIDSKEISLLFRALSKLDQLHTLNIEGNQISPSLICDFLQVNLHIKNCILRNCLISAEAIRKIEVMLSQREFNNLDISGLSLRTQAASEILKESQFEPKLVDKLGIFEITSSTKSINFFNAQVFMLHLYYVDFDESELVLANAFKDLKEIQILKVTKCQKENSFMRNLYFCLNKTKVNYLDISGNLMNVQNIKYLIKLINSQKNLPSNDYSRLIEIDLTDTQMEDSQFENLFISIIGICRIPIRLNFSNNKLTILSNYFLQSLYPISILSYFNFSSSFNGEQNDENLTKMKKNTDLCSFGFNSYYFPTQLQQFKGIISSDLITNELDLKRSANITEEDLKYFDGHTSQPLILVKLDDLRFASGSTDKTIKIWNIKNVVCEVTLLGHSDFIVTLLKLNDNILISGSKDGVIKIWRIRDWINIGTAVHNGFIIPICKIDQKTFMTVSSDSVFKFWEVEQTLNLKHIQDASWNSEIYKVACISNEMTITLSITGVLTIYDRNTWINNQIERCEANETVLYLLEIDERKFAIVFFDYFVICSIGENMIVTESAPYLLKSCVSTFILLENRKILASSSSIFEIFDIDELKFVESFNVGYCPVYSVINIGTYFISCSQHIYIQMSEKKPLYSLIITEKVNDRENFILGETGRIYCVLICSRQLTLFGIENGNIQIYEQLTMNLLNEIKAHNDSVYCMAEVEMNDLILAGSKDCTISIWKRTSLEYIRSLTGHTGGVYSLIVLNKNTIVSGSVDKTIKLWDILSFSCLMTLEGHDRYVYSVIKLDDDTLASGSGDNDIKIWKLSTKSCIGRLTENRSSVLVITQITSDTIVTGAKDGKLIVWNTYTYTFKFDYLNHNDEITGIAKLSTNVFASSCTKWKVCILDANKKNTIASYELNIESPLSVMTIQGEETLVLVGGNQCIKMHFDSKKDLIFQKIIESTLTRVNSQALIGEPINDPSAYNNYSEAEYAYPVNHQFPAVKANKYFIVQSKLK